MRISFFRRHNFAGILLVGVVAAGISGCNFIHNMGTGAHMDDQRPPPHHPVNVKTSDILVEVTTDANGAVTTVDFKRSSGSDAVDNYLAEDIRHKWPGTPSTTSLVELTYSASKGFSEPKLISTHPAT